jgi:hypothetical protein
MWEATDCSSAIISTLLLIQGHSRYIIYTSHEFFDSCCLKKSVLKCILFKPVRVSTDNELYIIYNMQYKQVNTVHVALFYFQPLDYFAEWIIHILLTKTQHY